MASKRFRNQRNKRAEAEAILSDEPEDLSPQDYSDRTLMNKPFEQVNGFGKPDARAHVRDVASQIDTQAGDLQQERSGEVEMPNVL